MNKYQEALQNLYSDAHAWSVGEMDNEESELLEILKTLQELVEKATPKKPIILDENDFFLWQCPSCDQKFISDVQEKYCYDCGQKLRD